MLVCVSIFSLTHITANKSGFSIKFQSISSDSKMWKCRLGGGWGPKSKGGRKSIGGGKRENGRGTGGGSHTKVTEMFVVPFKGVLLGVFRTERQYF